MRCLTLSGWGQPADSLCMVFPEADFVDYGECEDIKGVYDVLATREADVLIGWSLGGQIAVRAVAEKIIRPRLLVLLATPFQCAANSKYADATSLAVLKAFRNAYIENPAAAGREFQRLIAEGSNKSNEILELLLPNAEIERQNKWLSWFDELVRYSCFELDFDDFPPTLIIHGEEDRVVSCAQAEMFMTHIPSHKKWYMEGCGHAPHLHDAEAVKHYMERYYNNLI